MKKLIGQLHLWLGLSSGLIVFIISITGCIYVFEDELKSVFYKDRLYVDVPVGANKKPVYELYKIAQEKLGEEHPIQSIEVLTEANRSYIFRSALKRNPKAFTHFGEYEYHRMLYINPYTGALLANEDSKYEFFRIVLALHRNLLLRREIGLLIIGSSVLVFVFMLISGLILWLPKKLKGLKQRLVFLWKNTTKWKRKNYDLHNILGFYVSFLLSVVLLFLSMSFFISSPSANKLFAFSVAALFL